MATADSSIDNKEEHGDQHPESHMTTTPMTIHQKPKSVAQLTQWLSRFGERQQQHHARHQVGVARPRSIQRRVEAFENQRVAAPEAKRVVHRQKEQPKDGQMTAPGAATTKGIHSSRRSHFVTRSVASDVKLEEEEEAIEAVRKPVFRDCSNFVFQPLNRHSAMGSEDLLPAGQDQQQDSRQNIHCRAKEQTFTNQPNLHPQSWEDVEENSISSWDDGLDGAPKWHPNALPLFNSRLGSADHNDKKTGDMWLFDVAEKDGNVSPFETWKFSVDTDHGNRIKASAKPKASVPLPPSMSDSTRLAPSMHAPATGPTRGLGSVPPDCPGMHNASICSPHTLTSASLEYLCNGTLPNETASQVGSEQDSSNTASTWSDDSHSPSILPDALDSNMSRLFGPLSSASKDSRNNQHNQHDNHAWNKQYPPPILEVSTMEEAEDDISALPPCSDAEVSESTETNAHATGSQQNMTTCKRDQSTRSGLDDAIHSLNNYSRDGQVRSLETKNRLSTVQRAKLELEQQWAASRERVYVKKIQWAVDRKSGGYKKKVVLV